MRRIGILLMGAPLLAAWVNVAGCGGSDGAGLDNGADASANGDGSGPGGDFGNGGDGGPGSGSGGDGGLAACANAESATGRLPVYMDIILDGSQSMDGHGPPTSAVPCDPPSTSSTCYLKDRRSQDPEFPSRLTGKKWIAARGALKAYFEGLTASRRLGVGLYLFSSTIANDKRSIAIAPVTPAQRDLLYGTIKPETWPSGGTPLLESLKDQVPKLAAFNPGASLDTGGVRVILLMTDGVPRPDDEQGSIAEQGQIKDYVAAAYNNASTPIKTFVVGIGDPTDAPLVYNETFLSRVASVGGAPAVAGCNPEWDGANPAGTQACHTQVTPGSRSANDIQNDIKAAIDKAAIASQSCELPLQNVNSNIDTSKVNVLYTPGGQKEVQLAPAEWSLNSPPTKVTLNGARCNALKADPNAKVRVIIGCKTGDVVIH